MFSSRPSSRCRMGCLANKVAGVTSVELPSWHSTPSEWGVNRPRYSAGEPVSEKGFY